VLQLLSCSQPIPCGNMRNVLQQKRLLSSKIKGIF
jgi:hypothetical protein